MEREVANKLLLAELEKIYAYSLSRLYDKTAAEDLSQEIIYELLKSISNLRQDAAFYGYLWRVAENTFCKYIRRHKSQTVELCDDAIGVYIETPEQEVIHKEDLYILRRELALLSDKYRRIALLYYMDAKSCSEIATLLSVSEEMVKYYLFTARKKLKEGIHMTRTLGEKSYNPGTFRMDFWGSGNNNDFWNLFNRKLPGNILLTAYHSPVTVQELSSELGVSLPYLEDEIDILLHHEMLRKVGEKIQTDIVIFTEKADHEIFTEIKPLINDTAAKFYNEIKAVLPKLRTLEIQTPKSSDHYLSWVYANYALMIACMFWDTSPDLPLLCNGARGYVYGYDNDYATHHFHGIYNNLTNADQSASVSVVNYRVISCSQNWNQHGNSGRSIQAMTDAILKKEVDINNEVLLRYIEESYVLNNAGILSPNFPVMPFEIYHGEVKDLLKPAA
ncbi:MAG: sigma-70 family RNA polymerase sigma factor, partial [Lachnospiraceae bacterium]|nr:sigma-70 family RNA polymerase sigma factor [Lachnospiraceae bacterium]